MIYYYVICGNIIYYDPCPRPPRPAGRTGRGRPRAGSCRGLRLLDIVLLLIVVLIALLCIVYCLLLIIIRIIIIIIITIVMKYI